MKCSELLRKLYQLGWIKTGQNGSHIKLEHPEKGIIIFPDHGSDELGKGIEKTIKKKAGLIIQKKNKKGKK